MKLLDGEIRRNEIKVKGLTTMICNLERRQEDLEADVLSSDLVLQQNEQQKKNLDVLIQSNQESLTRKRKELEEAKELLELLKKQQTEKGEYLAKINNELSHLKDELQFIKRDEFRTYKGRTYEAISNHLIKTATHFLGLLIDKVEPRLPQSYRFPFDNFVKESDLFCFSEGSEEIIESALSIFLGGKDEIGAELLSSAGGGNSSAGGWRKRDDEDEDAYLNRCVAMAFRRYKKSKGLIRK